MEKKILAISHAFLKKINLSFYEELSKDKKFKITCLLPENLLYNNKKIYPDFKSQSKYLKIKKLKLSNNSTRFFYLSNLKSVIKSAKPDYVILDNDTVSVQSIILFYYSFFFNYKLCYFCNENNLKNIFTDFNIKKFIKLLIVYPVNFIIKFKVFKVFCYTNQIKENYNILGFKNKTCLMPLGYDEKVFNLKKKRKKDFFAISYFGRIIPEKGIHILINSLKNLKYKNWKFMLDIDQVENIFYFKSIIKLFKKNFKGKKIKFIRCNHYNIAKYMGHSDVVVLPSLYQEQYGRVIQESVACGAIAVGSDIGAIPEIIKDKELLFESGNHKALSIILNKLYNKSFYNKKFKKLYQKIKNERTIQKQLLVFKKELK